MERFRIFGKTLGRACFRNGVGATGYAVDSNDAISVGFMLNRPTYVRTILSKIAAVGRSHGI